MAPAMTNPQRERRAVRILMLDERDRVLLFLSARRGWWQAPGGGLKPGEDVRAAAAREIFEETGLHGLRLGAEVWRRRYLFTYDGVDYDQRERWFTARVDGFEPDFTRLTEEERIDLAGWRWWTLDELDATRDRFVIADFAQRLREIVEHGPPDLPIELGTTVRR